MRQDGIAGVVSQHWAARDVAVAPLDAGRNNPTLRVGIAGRCYAARLYRNLDVAGIRREHALLGVLAGAGLPFRVPQPAPCRDGRTFAHTDDGILALFAWIGGQYPDRGNPGHLYATGAALAELDEALLRLDGTLAGLPGDPAPRHGELHRIHPAVPDAAALPRRLADDPRLREVAEPIAWLEAAIADCLQTVPRLYAGLPQQWVHQDLALSNVLQRGGRVRGVLDFEFADRDLRALDLVSMLTNTIGDFADPAGWQQAETLCRGYCARVRLGEAEIEALPDLVRLRYVAVNIHGAGRWLAGLNPVEEVARRLLYGAACDRIIQQQADRLRGLVRAVSVDRG